MFSKFFSGDRSQGVSLALNQEPVTGGALFSTTSLFSDKVSTLFAEPKKAKTDVKSASALPAADVALIEFNASI